MFKKILGVMNIISQIILMITAVISLFTAYIVFAPDDLPKPFHLVYAAAGDAPTVAVAPAVSTAPAPETHTYQPGEGVMVNMSTKIINLLDPGGRKYIRVTIVVEFAPDDPTYQSMSEEEKTAYLTQFQDKLNARMPIMDDTVITLLSTKTYDELYTAEGKEKLRLEIMDTLSGKLPDLQIISIYFTEFVVQ
jgi:flagellar protein FliL